MRQDAGLKPGDVVYLKSGSPKMTVTEYNTIAGTAGVVWSVFETQELKFATLPAITLRKGE